MSGWLSVNWGDRCMWLCPLDSITTGRHGASRGGSTYWWRNRWPQIAPRQLRWLTLPANAGSFSLKDTTTGFIRLLRVVRNANSPHVAPDLRPFLAACVWYRHHGAAKRLAEVVASGGVGAVQRVDVEFSLPSLGSWWASIRPPRAVPPDLDEHLRYKMLDRWCYCVDSAVWIARAAGLRDGVTVESAVATHGSFEAVLSAASAGGLPIDFRLTASKDRLEVPRWDVTVTGVSGSCRVVNIGFPFLYHRVVVNETESTFYGEGMPFAHLRPLALAPNNAHSLTHSVGSGETTFEYQLEAFVAAIKGVGFLSDEDGHEREHQLLQTMRAVDASVVKADLPPFISWRPERQ